MPARHDDATGDGASDAHEARLIAQAQRGDRQAFGELVERYQSKVFNLAYRLLNDPDEAADVSQEAFLRIYRGIDKFHGGSQLGTWIYRIVHNLCLDELKKKRRRPQIVADPADDDGDGGDSLLDRLPDESAEPQSQIMTSETQRLVRAAIARLKPHHRDVLVLYDLMGHSYNEIADMLCTNVGTIKSRLNRARLALSKELENERELFS